MSTVSLRQAHLPGTRALYADFLERFERVRSFYAYPPSIEAACQAASAIRIEPGHRRRLADALAEQNAAADAATLASLDRLAAAGTVAVATGQQVGLLGGPAFTLYKALTAVRCAEELTRRGVPAVPVFWLATEDHDLPEVNHAWVGSLAGSPVRLEAETRGAGGAAVGEIEVVDARLSEFGSVAAGQPYAAESVALAQDHYGAPAGFGESFRGLYRQLLQGTGIVFLSPMEEGVRSLAAPFVRRALKGASGLTDLLLRRGDRLRQCGYHQQVQFQPSTSLVMLFESARRMALQRRNGAYWLKSREYSTRELLARLEQAPRDLSPTALLRPVMQDYLLPTAALVAGPSEAAYLAQSAVLYRELLGRMPVVLPRASFTVLDSTCRKLLGKYGMSLADCMVPERDLEGRIACQLVPRPLSEALDAREASIGESLAGIDAALQSFDPTLSASFAVSRKKIAYHLDKIRSKVARESLRRAGTAGRHAATLAHALYPNGHPQERVYSVLCLIAKFGPSLVERVRAETQPGCAEHRVIEC